MDNEEAARIIEDDEALARRVRFRYWMLEDRVKNDRESGEGWHVETKLEETSRGPEHFRDLFRVIRAIEIAQRDKAIVPMLGKKECENCLVYDACWQRAVKIGYDEGEQMRMGFADQPYRIEPVSLTASAPKRKGKKKLSQSVRATPRFRWKKPSQ